MKHCKKPRWWRLEPAKEEELWRILQLIDQVARERGREPGEDPPQPDRRGDYPVH